MSIQQELYILGKRITIKPMLIQLGNQTVPPIHLSILYYAIYYICILSPTITVTTIERTNKLIYNKQGMRGRLLKNKSYNLLKQSWISRISHLTEDQLMALLRFLFHRMAIRLLLFCTWTLNLIHGLIFTRLLWARLPLLSSVYLKPIRKGMDGSTSKWMI